MYFSIRGSNIYIFLNPSEFLNESKPDFHVTEWIYGDTGLVLSFFMNSEILYPAWAFPLIPQIKFMDEHNNYLYGT